MSSRADVAVIGGSGSYSFLDDPEQVQVSTPYGDPSAPVSVGEIGGRRVAFLPRHGRHHEYPPHRINYRANLWALRSLGVRQVLAACAVGGLRDEVAPDQLVDRTSGRERTFVERAAPSTCLSPTPTARGCHTFSPGPTAHDGAGRWSSSTVALLHPRRVARLRRPAAGPWST